MASQYHHTILAPAVLALLLASMSVSPGAQNAPPGQFTLPERGTLGARRPTALDATAVQDILEPRAARRALNALGAEVERSRRGAIDAAVFRNASPSVVYVTTPDGFGSGSMLPENQILTNWHVVGKEKQVGVVFRPEGGADVTQAKVVVARVVRIDEMADLALLELSEPAPAFAKPLPLAAAGSLSIGDDVHAIGHPTGEAWTYTKGYVSQIRPKYQWITPGGVKHSADVVQTQTPINPGNSGGPLLDNAGALVGVNAFRVTESEGLNFAVAVGEVQTFLTRVLDRIADRVPCKAKALFEGRNKNDDADLTILDTDCDEKPDAYFVVSDLPADPNYLYIDSDQDGEPEGEIQDRGRDGKWDISYWDDDGDGKPDLEGRHPNGELKPSSFVPYRS